MAFGIDYSYGSGLSANQMKAAGVTFVCRYLSYQPNSKNITPAEFANLRKAGLTVVLVWEGSGHEGGSTNGASAAREANRQAAALGAGGIPIYFAPCDYDVPPGDQAGINAYLDGAASVIGRARTGLYGGYWPVKRAFDAGKMHYGWQTYAWSGNNVDNRAHLYQYRNGMRMGPADVDFDRSLHTDYGGWPRPKAAAAAKPPPKAAPIPPEDDMSMVYLDNNPRQNAVPLPLGKEVVRLRFFALGTETIKVDQVGVTDPSVDIDLGYDVMDAGAGGVGINPKCLGVRVVRDTKKQIPRNADGHPCDADGNMISWPSLGCWFVTA